MILKNVVRYFFRKKLRLSEKREHVNRFHFDEAGSVGIIFNADSPAQIEAVKNYILILNNHGKRVEAVGLTKMKRVELLSDFGLNIRYLTSKDKNIFGFPKPDFVDNFVERKIDLLIDLTVDTSICSEYIAALSNASLKVGYYSKRNEELYDMMLNIDKSKNLDYFIEQVDIYLKMINKAA